MTSKKIKGASKDLNFIENDYAIPSFQATFVRNEAINRGA